MIRQTTYLIERDDDRALQPRRIEELESLLAGLITEADRVARVPGLRAIGKIRGNMPVTAEEIGNLETYVRELLGRHADSVARLDREAAGVEDEWSKRAYDGVRSMTEAGGRAAGEILDRFIEAFRDGLDECRRTPS